MANRDDWERNRNRGWERDRDWEMEDRFNEERSGPRGGEGHRERWGTSDRFGRSGSAGGGSGRGGWEREDEGFRDYGLGRSFGEHRGTMAERDWERYPREGYGRFGEPLRERFGREEGIGGYGAETFREGWGREGAVGTGRSHRRSYATDWRRGPFSGRGPKGWKRSDERIQEDVNEALARHPDLDASSIEVKVQNGEVTLSGVVEDRGDKRLAEDIAEEVFGVDDVHNELKVRHGAFATLTGEKADEVDEREARQSATTTTPRGTTRTRTR